MGLKLSIDKHVSNLDEVLEISAQYYSKVKFESKIKDDITHHLKVSRLKLTNKVWRFAEDNAKFDAVRTSPVPLSTISSSGFKFSTKDAYLVLFIFKTGFDGKFCVSLSKRRA